LERKKILRRAALIGGAVLLMALAAAVATRIAHHRSEVESRRLGDEHIAQLTKEYQASLDETAKTITKLPVDAKVVGEIQTRHYQQRLSVWLYVWASTNDGGFLFGVPSDDFARLNALYDLHRQTIAQDHHFANRDQFLRAFLHNFRRIEPPKASSGEDRPRDREADWWRFHRDDGAWPGRQPVMLSSPIQDGSGATVGNLNMKLVDTRDAASLSRRGGGPWREWRNASEACLGLAALSLVWLWFLLPSWVYIDAQEHNVPRPLLWAFLTLVGSVLALMVYLVSRPTDVKELRCPQCGKTLNGSKAGCPYCGADLSAVYCPQCQYPLKPDWTFCPSCRAALTRAAVVPASVQRPEV
jgi:Double zinc ribbon